MDTIFNDLRYAARSLWSTPGFPSAAVLTLAIGIGAITAIFSIVDYVILLPLAYANPDRSDVVQEFVPRFAVSPRDPVTLLSVSLVLLTVGVLGCYIPARHAMRVDP